MTLYEMTAAGRELLEMLESGDIDEQTFADTLSAIGVDEKVDTYCKIIRQLTADAESIKTEIDRMTTQKTKLENECKRMKETLLAFMQGTGQLKFKSTLFSCNVGVSKSCNVTDESIIPAEYLKPQPAKIDRAAILKAMKAGEVILGAEIVESAYVTIR